MRLMSLPIHNFMLTTLTEMKECINRGEYSTLFPKSLGIKTQCDNDWDSMFSGAQALKEKLALNTKIETLQFLTIKLSQQPSQDLTGKALSSINTLMAAGHFFNALYYFSNSDPNQNPLEHATELNLIKKFTTQYTCNGHKLFGKETATKTIPETSLLISQAINDLLRLDDEKLELLIDYIFSSLDPISTEEFTENSPVKSDNLYAQGTLIRIVEYSNTYKEDYKTLLEKQRIGEESEFSDFSLNP